MSVLTDGDSSRLHRLLVEEKKLAIEVERLTSPEGFDPGLTWLQLTLPEGAKSPKSRRCSTRRWRRSWRRASPMPSSTRAKNLYASSFWKQLATINGKASLLGQFEVFEGDYQQAVRFAGRLRQGHARGRAEGRRAGVPEESPHGRRAAVAEAMKRRCRERHEAPLALRSPLLLLAWCAAGMSARRARGRRQGARQPALRAAERPHHRAGAEERRAADRVQRLRARRRARAIPADKPGVASLVAGLLDRGAGKRSAFEFADAVEGVGGSFNAGRRRGSDLGQRPVPGARSRADDRAARRRADAPASRRRRSSPSYRDREIEFIKSAKDSDPSQLIGIYGRAALFGEHPYGRPQGGSERSLAAHHARRRGRAITPRISAPTAPRWCSPAISIRSG